MLLATILALLFDTQSLVSELKRSFPAIGEMHVLEVGEGHFKDHLNCKSYALNDFRSNRAYDLVISDQIDHIDFLNIPNGFLLVSQDDPLHSIHLLNETEKHGKIFSRQTQQLVIWRKEINNYLHVTPTMENHRITYALSGGRLGDNLLAFLHRKWVSMQSGIPLQLHPFIHCNLFALHKLYSSYAPFKSKKRQLHSLNDILPYSKSISYFLPFFPDDRQEYETYRNHFGAYFYLDWQDPLFKEEIRKSLAPTFQPTPLVKPTDRKSVAIHIRTGGLYEDFDVGHKGYPLKFAPFHYYIDALRTLVATFPQDPLYVYIFSDDHQIPQLIERFKSHFNESDIIFDHSQLHSDPDDFFAMSEFDILIRGMSNFSIVSGFYGDPELIFACTRSHGTPTGTVIDETTIFYNFGL